MSASLPPNPSLDNLKKQAKGLLKAYRTGDPEALRRVRASHERFEGAAPTDTGDRAFTLRDAQHVLAREHGFPGWEQLSFVVGLKRRIFAAAKSGPREAPRTPFTDGVKQAMQSARQEAFHLKHSYIGTEHLLLGILQDEGGAAVGLLQDLGVNPAALVEPIRNRIGSTTPAGWPSDGRVFGPRAKTILESARAEAAELASKTVETSHMLLGLAKDADMVSARILGELGVDYEGVRRLLDAGSDA